MDKLQALEVLIAHHPYLDQEGRELLLARLTDMTEAELGKIGKFLATVQEKTIAENQRLLDNLNQLESMANTTV